MREVTSVILLEFNELSLTLIDRFLQNGKLPNFKQFYATSEVFTTDAGEQPPYLNPWIQWVTVHSGLPYRYHRIFHLGDGHKLKQKCLWDLISDSGRRVWVCGSMNVRYDLPMRGGVLPDPWTTESRPYPEDFQPYFKFVQQHVLEHTNDRVPLSKADYLRFLRFMLSNGLSAETVRAIAHQLLSERGGRNRWKRGVILDKLQFDLFRSRYQKERPYFSTFFLNSTAHFQHLYWRNFEPENFQAKPDQQEQDEFKDAILFGYQEMDKLLGRFFDLSDEGTVLVLSTGLSQQPCLKYEELGGKSFYRPREFETFLRFAGITAPHKVAPVMSEQFHVFFDSEKDAQVAEECLCALRVNDRVAMAVERRGESIFAGCAVVETVPKDALLSLGESNESVPFFDIFYQVEGKKSGMHHADGILWIRMPEGTHHVHEAKVPLTAIAPTILRLLKIPKPTFMQENSLLGFEAAGEAPRNSETRVQVAG